MQRIRRKCGVANTNIDFDELRRLLAHLGFVERVGGSHHVFVRAGEKDLVSLQREGRLAKPYQINLVQTKSLGF